MSKRYRHGRQDRQQQHDSHIRRYKIRLCRNYKSYEAKRRGEGRRLSAGIKNLRKMILAKWKYTSKHEAAMLLCLLDREFRRHSYRTHVTYMELHPGTVSMYGLKRIPSKSWLQGWAAALSEKIDFITDLLLAQSGADAGSTLAGDSSGFSIMRYEEWEDAKRGLVSRRAFDKLHILMAPHGRIVACEVTPGRRHDSPVFRDMYKRVPCGHGNVLLDSAYLAAGNCRAIADSGRTPVICPKRNSVPKGLGPMGTMLRWHRDDPDGFGKAYRQRSLVENAFSVIKERFGAVVRARTAVMRKLLLVLRCICYNLVA